MKRAIVLTSMLALTACGGGGSNSGWYVGTPDSPEQPFVPVADMVAASNSEITSMVSNSKSQVVTYVVNKLGNDAKSVGLDNVARAARMRGTFIPSVAADDADYTKANELMELAQWLGDATTTHDDITAMFNKSKADQDKIKSALKLLDDMWCYVGGNADETARRILERRGTTKFDESMAEIKEKSEIMTLDKVKFNVAGFDNGKYDENYTLNFGVKENGQIDRLVMNYINDTGASETTEATRKTIISDGEEISVFYNDVYKYQIGEYKTDSFDYKIDDRDALREEIADSLTGKSDETKQAILDAFDNGAGEWVTETHQHQFDLYGKKLATSLKYMDFGYSVLTVPDKEYKPDYSVIFGGYKNKQVEPTVIPDDKMEFTGTAIAAIAYSENNTYKSVPIQTEQNAATLTFDGKHETLIMPFNDYYTVTVERENDMAILSFDDFKGDDDGYKFVKESGISTANANDLAHVAIKYYGNNGAPTEAGGIVAHEEWTNGLKSFEAAFGATIK